MRQFSWLNSNCRRSDIHSICLLFWFVFTFNLHMHGSEVSQKFEYCVYTEYGASSLWLPSLWDFLPCFLAAVIVPNFVLCFCRLLKTRFFSTVLAVLYGAINCGLPSTCRLGGGEKVDCPSSFFWVSIPLTNLPALVHSLVPSDICFVILPRIYHCYSQEIWSSRNLFSHVGSRTPALADLEICPHVY